MDDPSKQSILVELGAVDALGKSKTTLYLEDESGRIEVVLGEQISDIIVSGMIIGIMGIEVSGRFLAAKVFQCGAPPTTSTHNAVGSTHRSILLFSDVDFQSMKWSLLVENFENLIAPLQVECIFFIGNCIGRGSKVLDSAKRYGQDTFRIDINSLHRADRELQFFAKKGIRCVIVPGLGDATSSLLPQEPIPSGLFKQCSKSRILHCISNPGYVEVMGKRVLLLSGESINDCLRYNTKGEKSDPLSVAESLILNRHMSPSSPDVSKCHPYSHSDPFILNDYPDLIVFGLQERSSFCKVRESSTNIAAVPSFARTGEMLVLRGDKCTTLKIY